MKAPVFLCFILLAYVSAPVEAKSIKSKHAYVSAPVEAKSIKSKHETEVNRSKSQEISEEGQPDGEITDAQKEADANKCTCELPAEDNQKKTKCADKCDCSKQETKKCHGDKKSCNCNPKSRTAVDEVNESNDISNATKKCNCKCSTRSNTAPAALAQVSDDPGVLAVAPLSPQANGCQGMRKGKGSKKCCCCDCCHDCCCHDCCCHCCEPCCCCCHCCEPCCCCCHECCCPCCCHCCHCCPCCCHCCCKKSKSLQKTPQPINPLIAGEHAKPQHH